MLAVKTLDTNVVVRLLIGDDPQQTPIAEQAFLDAIASAGVVLPDVVLAELAWVLRAMTLSPQPATSYWSGWCAPAVWWWMTSTR